MRTRAHTHVRITFTSAVYIHNAHAHMHTHTCTRARTHAHAHAHMHTHHAHMHTHHAHIRIHISCTITSTSYVHHVIGHTYLLSGTSPMELQWTSIKEQIQAEALHLSSISSKLDQEALQPLQVYMLVDLEKRFRMVREEGGYVK